MPIFFYRRTIRTANNKAEIWSINKFKQMGFEFMATCCYISYSYQRPPRDVVASVPQPWVIGLSDSGWMKSDIFFEYIVIFFEYIYHTINFVDKTIHAYAN